jgi:hypothetical protein
MVYDGKKHVHYLFVTSVAVSITDTVKGELRHGLHPFIFWIPAVWTAYTTSTRITEWDSIQNNCHAAIKEHCRRVTVVRTLVCGWSWIVSLAQTTLAGNLRQYCIAQHKKYVQIIDCISLMKTLTMLSHPSEPVPSF